MTPADLARKNSISLEAKKDALSQRQSGDWKVSFTVQGSDMDARLTQAPMGTRFAMVLVEIGDDELPVQKETAAKPRQNSSPNPTGGAKRMDWRDVQPTAQAGIRCAEPRFWTYLWEEQGLMTTDSEEAAENVRRMCGIKSRAELSTNHKARTLWYQLDSGYREWAHL